MNIQDEFRPGNEVELLSTSRLELEDFVGPGAAVVQQVCEWGLRVRWLGTVGPSDFRWQSETWTKLVPVPGITDADRASTEELFGRPVGDHEVDMLKDMNLM